jgi:hypothetical protein
MERATLFFLLTSGLMAQKAFEESGQVVYADVRGNRTNLGAGFNPLITSDGRVVFLRGRRFGYGDPFDCGNKETRNSVAVYNPVSGATAVLFDEALPFDGRPQFCIFDQMQLSPNGSTLYLVALVYATSGSLAIVQLAHGTVEYVPGVNCVYVIGTGPHKGELIYQRRTLLNSQVAYPFIHVRADGRQITIISNLTEDPAPLLRQYLRKIAGTITIDGQKLP